MILYQESRFYNTFLCVSLGIWFSVYRQPIERFVQQPTKGRILAFIIGPMALYILGGILLLDIYDQYEFLYIPLPLLFMVSLLFLTMIWRFANPILQFMGERLFSVFILMRIPMIIFSHIGLDANAYVFLFCSFCATVLLACLFDLFLGALDRVFFPSLPQE